jgi:TOBE domain
VRDGASRGWRACWNAGQPRSVRVAPDAVGPVGSEVRIMVRPEEIELSPDRRDSSGTVIPVTVRERFFLGDAVTYEVTTRDGQHCQSACKVCTPKHTPGDILSSPCQALRLAAAAEPSRHRAKRADRIKLSVWDGMGSACLPIGWRKARSASPPKPMRPPSVPMIAPALNARNSGAPPINHPTHLPAN